MPRPRVTAAWRIGLDGGRLPLDAVAGTPLGEALEALRAAHDLVMIQPPALRTSETGTALAESPHPLLRELEWMGASLNLSSVLLERSAELLGQAFDLEVVDRVWCVLSPTMDAGYGPPVGGFGVPVMGDAWRLAGARWTPLGSEVLCEGEVAYPHAPN